MLFWLSWYRRPQFENNSIAAFFMLGEVTKLSKKSIMILVKAVQVIIQLEIRNYSIG